jgi:hypothetical protein
MPLVTPQISINGTNPRNLVEDYSRARSALMEAVRALQEASPNGRDYQRDPTEFEAARRQHADRIKRLESVRHELEELAEFCVERIAG